MTAHIANLVTEALEEKVFEWGQIEAGDCRQDDARLVIRSDGTATFTSTIWTHHGVDYWHATIFLRGPDGELGHSAEIRSAGMPHDHDGPNNRISFGLDFPFPKEF
jgi:hypothetical protein